MRFLMILPGRWSLEKITLLATMRLTEQFFQHFSLPSEQAYVTHSMVIAYIVLNLTCFLRTQKVDNGVLTADNSMKCGKTECQIPQHIIS